MRVPLDCDTAVTAYHKLRQPPFGFLLESLVGGEKGARYTFAGTAPRSAWRVETRSRLPTWTPDSGSSAPRTVGDPLAELNALLRAAAPVTVAGLPRFLSGAVGYLGYDMIRYIERLPNAPRTDSSPKGCTPRQHGREDAPCHLPGLYGFVPHTRLIVTLCERFTPETPVTTRDVRALFMCRNPPAMDVLLWSRDEYPLPRLTRRVATRACSDTVG